MCVRFEVEVGCISLLKNARVFFWVFYNTRVKPNKCMNTPGSYKYNDYIYINSRFESSPNEEEERKKIYEEVKSFSSKSASSEFFCC